MIYLLAFLGGLILNLMPCCWPVVFMKIASAQHRSWQFAAGSISVFVLLGCLCASLGLMWGEWFERNWFTWTLAALVFALGLSYLDIWQFPSFGCRDATTDFGRGILSTLISTACSGPLLSAVFAASLTEPPWKTVALFFAIGVGFMTPYLAVPRGCMPRPGDWLNVVKKLAGVSMIATALWLVDVKLIPLAGVALSIWLWVSVPKESQN